MTMTDDEQRDIFVRGATIAVCAVAATVTLPMVGQIQAEKRADADFREQAVRLASMEDAGVSVRTAAYAPALLDTPWMRTVEYTLERDTGSSMSRFAMRDRDGAALNSLVSFRPEHIKRAEAISAEQKCMAQAVYYESAHEPLDGQMAVAEVIANRMRDHRYPDTACGVVFQGATRTTGCQFTFTCDGALSTPPMGRNWERAKTIAAHVMMNLSVDNTGGATHYHATYVDPIWSAGLVKTDKIGMHVFYRFPRGSEWASVRKGYEAKRAEVRMASLSADEVITPVDGAATSHIQTVEAPTIAPATVTTSDRTITNGAPRLTTIKSVDYVEPELNTPSNADKIAAYMAKQTGITVASNDVNGSALQ
ncbi:cell wall hydrolase [Hyphomonas oceanitis]|uniref:Hydrolase n=2 Tax=Hyphomonas oceanitis TaxID=81033 RepID=A0A059GB65_9PROT|nr:hydrolase [Hyphomonas oceanitis SCH89]